MIPIVVHRRRALFWTAQYRTLGKTACRSLGDDCWIATQAVLVQGSGLEAHSVLGAGAVLTKKPPDRTMAAGVPAKPLDRAKP